MKPICRHEDHNCCTRKVEDRYTGACYSQQDWRLCAHYEKSEPSERKEPKVKKVNSNKPLPKFIVETTIRLNKPECSMLDGPCACGAWHKAEDWEPLFKSVLEKLTALLEWSQTIRRGEAK